MFYHQKCYITDSGQLLFSLSQFICSFHSKSINNQLWMKCKNISSSNECVCVCLSLYSFPYIHELYVWTEKEKVFFCLRGANRRSYIMNRIWLRQTNKLFAICLSILDHKWQIECNEMWMSKMGEWVDNAIKTRRILSMMMYKRKVCVRP